MAPTKPRRSARPAAVTWNCNSHRLWR
jgi:hypothetical protein